MAAWELIKALERLRGEFNAIAPNRDKRSDGSVGDQAHADSQSDHNPDETGNVPIRDADKVNEVHAIDVDADLRVPGLDMLAVVLFLVGRCVRGQERRLRYIIFNRTIWAASSDWIGRRYTGANPHTEHAHFSGSYVSSLEASTASWHLEDIPVAMTDEDRKFVSGLFDALKKQIDGVDEAVRTTIRNNKETLSDTEKNELVDRTSTATIAGVVKALTPTPPGSGS